MGIKPKTGFPIFTKGGVIMFKKLILVFATFQVNALELNLGDLEIPAVCEAIPGLTMPVDLSPACLAAQMAASAQPYLLPAANQLCQILEGTTAAVGVIQIQVNTAIEICQEAMLDLEKQMMFGASPQIATFMNNLYEHKKRLSGINSYQDLINLARSNDQLVAGLEQDDWDPIIDKSKDESVAAADRKLFEALTDTQYLVKKNLQEGGLSQQAAKVKTMLETTGSQVKLKEAQDMNVRMTAELVYQQHVFQQMLAQYLALQSAESLLESKHQDSRYKFFKGGDDEN